MLGSQAGSSSSGATQLSHCAFSAETMSESPGTLGVTANITQSLHCIHVLQGNAETLVR